VSDIQELFARDPLKLTKDDITEIVEKFRASRHQFNLGNLKAGSTKPPTEKQKKIDAVAKSFNFDLDL
jgi:hypothetical protein